MYVRSYAQRQIGRAALQACAVVPARLEQILEFQFGDPFVVDFADGSQTASPRAVIVGLQTEHVNIVFGRATESFGIFFQPSGMSELFGVPANEFSNRYFEATSVLGSPADLLAEKLADKSFDERVRLTEDFLLSFARRARVADPITRAAQHLFTELGSLRIPELAQHCGLGMRQFQRKFEQKLGIGAKVYARVARFQTALDRKITRPDRSWLVIAHELGYHDQMHMIREFKSLGGGVPGLLIRQIADGRPPALTTENVRELAL